MYLGYGMTLIAFVSPPQTSPLARFIESPAARWLATIGVYSYSTYLWHEDTGVRMVRFLHANLQLSAVFEWPLLTAVYLAIGIAFGCFMTRLVEWPILAIRERLLPSSYQPIARPVPSHKEISWKPRTTSRQSTGCVAGS